MLLLETFLMCHKATQKNLIGRQPTIPNFIIQKKQDRHSHLLCFFLYCPLTTDLMRLILYWYLQYTLRRNGGENREEI